MSEKGLELRNSAERIKTLDAAVIAWPGERPEQQDAYDVFSYGLESGGKGAALEVADGHGEHGKEAADLAVRRAREAIVNGARDEASLKDFFSELHAEEAREFPGSGTTLSLALKEGKKVTVAYVGDSEVWLFKDNGLQRLVVPHRYKEHAEETQWIEKGSKPPIYNGALSVDGGGNYIHATRSLGNVEYEPYMRHEPEIRSMVLDGSEKFLLVGSDGFWHATTSRGKHRSELRDLLRDSHTASEAQDRIKSLLERRKQGDNATLVLLGLDG